MLMGPKYDRRVFRERLVNAMWDRDVSSVALANWLQVTPHTVMMYRNGKNEPKAEGLYYISQALGVSVDWLLGLEEEI